MNQNNHFQFAVNDTPVSWTLHDRGTWQLEDNILTICDGWASTDDLEMKNFIFDFEARCSSDTPQVQIWAGFRHYSRDYRYVAALRGGNNNHLYLARMGAEGYDKMLDLRPLEWSAQPGKWYHIRIVCAGRTIAMYVNHQEKPLLLVKDEAAPFETGGIALGGSFLPTQYRNISLQPVSEDFLNHAVSEDSYLSCVTLSAEEKIKKRQKDRAKYRSFVVSRLPEEHLELSLNGNWLFIPDYEVFQNPAAFDCDDSAAHVMPVPASWIPLKAWLEGESMGDLNKGMNDTYLVEENIRCMNQTFDYEKTQFTWYRHYLDLPIGICKKHVILDFEGIALISAVYINGTKVHENIGMFAPMQIDISDHVKEVRNLIAVEVHRRLSSESEHAFHSASIDDKYATAWDILDEKKVAVSQWEHREFCTDDIPHGFYSDNPGGIWKNAKLIITDKIHVNECYFRPALEDAAIQVEYANTGVADREVSLFYSLTHKTTGEYLCGGPVEKLLLKAGEKRSISFTTPKVKPLLWGPKTPNLYDLCFTLENNGQVLDTFHEQVGFRTVEFDGSTLLYNGQPLWVRGGNHMPAHVNPNNRELARAFMTMALKHNVIASRTHVAPWSSVWLDAADEAGLLVSFEGTWSWLML
ncbi:MAG: hypothetical protein IJ390_05370, partial [Lachnospiraceae bacterium]|nr:hypothetical protein [Lachnospiraceae bacterium]